MVEATLTATPILPAVENFFWVSGLNVWPAHAHKVLAAHAHIAEYSCAGAQCTVYCRYCSCMRMCTIQNMYSCAYTQSIIQLRMRTMQDIAAQVHNVEYSCICTHCRKQLRMRTMYSTLKYSCACTHCRKQLRICTMQCTAHAYTVEYSCSCAQGRVLCMRTMQSTVHAHNVEYCTCVTAVHAHNVEYCACAQCRVMRVRTMYMFNFNTKISTASGPRYEQNRFLHINIASCPRSERI